MCAHPRLTSVLAGLGVSALLLTAGPDAHAATPAPHARTAPSVVRLTIKGYAFTPKTRTVVPGTTVTWTNTDSAIHTVVSDTTAFMASQDLPTGTTFTHTVVKVGTFRYHCDQHAFMAGTVIVKRVTR